ncbi:CHAT domain-containing protein [Candidatus Bipolaricaulota bacterium]|nr:CHAT domain-containing protein [Candidatus Bipolaricaulota bacterium]
MTAIRKALLLLSAAPLLASIVVYADTLHVPEDYPTIQAAIDAAQPGDTVYIAAGTYRENLTIEKALRLSGAGRTSVRIEAGDGEAAVIEVRLEIGDVMVENVSVAGGVVGLQVNAGSEATVDVRQTLAVANKDGIAAFGSGAVIMSHCLVVDSSFFGIILNCREAELHDVEVGRASIGILLYGRGDVGMSDCLIGLCEYGVDTYTVDCGWGSGDDAFRGTIEGGRNRVYGTLCPDYSDSLWPPGFLDIEWQGAVGSIVSSFNEGARARQAQEYRAALDAYLQCHALFASDGISFPLLQAYVSQNLGIVYDEFGRYEEALAEYAAADVVYADRGMDLDVAEIDQNIGNVCLDRGQHEAALAKYAAARATYGKHSMDIRVAAVDLKIGDVYWSLGLYKEALAKYAEVRAVFVEQGTDVQVAEVDNSVGIVYDDLGRYEEALAKHEEARAVFVTQRMIVDVAKTDLNIGIVHEHVGQYNEALAKYEEARAVFTAQRMDVHIATADQNIGSVYWALGLAEEALVKYDAVREIFVEQGMSVDVAVVDQNTGILYDSLRRYPEAIAKYEEARTVFVEQRMDVHVATIDQSISIVYQELGWYTEALAAHRSALSVLDAAAPAEGMEYSHPSTRWRVKYAEGTAHEALRTWDEAVAAYESAIAVIESIRAGLASEELKLAWHERTWDVYERLVDLLYRTEQGASALAYAERCRARTFLDLVAMGPVGRLESIAEEGIRSGVVEVSVIEADLAEVIASLPPDSAALEYFVTDEATYLWLVRDGAASDPIEIEIARSDLLKQALGFRTVIETSSTGLSDATDEATFTLSRDLYELLIAPVEDLLDGIDHLVIVPSGPLYYLPFCALIDCPDCAGLDLLGGEYLIERYALSYIPSLTTLKYAQASAEEADTDPLFLALADPDSGDPEVPRLPDAQDEADAVAKLFDPSEVYVDAAATEDVVTARASSADHLLLSTHGVFNPLNPVFSYLLLAPSEDSDGRLYTHEIFSLDLHTDLVTLSACETLLPALGEIEAQVRAVRGIPEEDTVEINDDLMETLTAGDEIVGLTRAFIFAGTASVLSSLWRVVSETTEPLMVAFYGYLADGLDKANALQRAQRDVMASYPHPRYWAAFELVGDWRSCR